MDILSHALWAGAAAKAVNKKLDKKLNPYFAGIFGALPDAFSFGLPMLVIFLSIIFGAATWADIPTAYKLEPFSSGHFVRIFNSISTLYDISHSVPVFFVVFGAVWFLAKRPVWEMCGWLLHILMDVPTHSYQFYPTPVFWPVWDWKFDGFSWGTPLFMILNYSALIAVYFLLRKRKSRP